MATYYVSSVTGNDANDGSTWALAKGTIAGAFAVATADGDIIYVDSAHSFTASAAYSLTDTTTVNQRLYIISVNRNGSTTTGHSGWQAGATEIGAGGAAFNIANSGRQRLYFYGCTLKTANTASSNNDFNLAGSNGATFFTEVVMENCTIGVDGASATGATVSIGSSHGSTAMRQHVRLVNCTVLLPNTTNSGNGIVVNCVWLEWINTTVTASASQTPTLFNSLGIRATQIDIIGSDLSNYTVAGGALFPASVIQGGQIVVRNCKLHSNTAIVSGTFPVGSEGEIIVINCDDGDTKTVFGYYKEQGTLLSTESIYRNSGFSVGGVNVGWHLVTTSSCNEMNPFVTPWVTGGWNASVASLNADFKIIHDSGTNLHNRNLWSEVEYVSDASFPKGTLASNRNANPFDGTSVDWTADTDAWTGTGGFASPNKQRVRATFTPAEGSAIRGRLFVGEASKTLYIEPQLILS
jgi:hypothetical protein